ncbi:MAG: glycoside hydrolase family 125 protein [Anaerolineae bacterium]|nr:glycoside hydrolase family 125 protein [Anaerolineae bacterium]
MTELWEANGYKPLDFGADGITGSVDRNGRIIALNCYHPQHGYVTLTSALPFPESERYNPTAVRAYRKSLVNLEGFGFQFDSAYVEHATSLWHSSIPIIRLSFPNGGDAEVMTLACAGGVIQKWQMYNMNDIPLTWDGQLSLQRCAYTQLTEGGPIPIPPIETHARFKDGLLTIENPALGWAVAIAGLPGGESWEQRTNGPISVHLKRQAGGTVLAYGFSFTVEIASANALRLAQNAIAYSEQANWYWDHLNKYGDNLLLQHGLTYSLMMAVPVDEGVCFLTDHMILPLSWNRDSYYTARALLGVNPETNDLVRRHLIWLFEQAERRDGAWGRCYLANGQIKDGAFQLDQQLFPLLELAEYVLETNDQVTLKRLQLHIQPLIDMLMARKAPNAMLFPTDETPADDPIALPYHLSSHILFWHVLNKLSQLGIEGNWASMAEHIRQATDRSFIAEHIGKRLYAYATDGDRKYHFYHDANDIPLALMPAWGLVSADDRVWRATVDFAFSEENVGGYYNGRLGSVHTKAAWALGDIQDLIIARAIGDAAREQRAWDHLRDAAQWDGALPEAYDPETGEVVSRHWFAWPNAALVCVERGVFST